MPPAASLQEEGDDLGYEDDYPVENVTISTGDYMFPRPSGSTESPGLSFEGPVNSALRRRRTEVTQKLSLNFKTLDMGVDWIIATLNMQPCDNTGKVEQGGRGHTVLLSGTFLGGQTCLVKALVGMDAERGCVARVSARAKSADICQVVVNALM
ncbi:Coatomer subunit gamma-2 [Symbiodinium microadriaticum]|uniref:Coatomer subunit gamma-2 n=1 Tax=Symbiodinium microadriaticum TaxID=2951 RepID=A0A1Q9ECY2_SYMMI|nr:Coatomer subunit gamma-2 [Symbiodinium microadriaticum]